MSDDASTAYICIYCPFNSDNLEALENHLARTHEHGCQEALSLPTQPLSSSSLSTSSNVINKAGKREAPDDEQAPSPLNDLKQTAGTNKRIKRTSSPSIFINGTNEHSEEDDEYSEIEDGDDERDSSSNTIFTCPICKSTFPQLAYLVHHAKRKHQLNLSDYDGPQTFDMLTTQINQNSLSNVVLNKNSLEENNAIEVDEINSDKQSNEVIASSTTTTTPTVSDNNTTTTNDCYYCDYKTNDIEQLKSHIIAHIRDKNYRCLLCNRLYKYRGDCSFHIRRKHHRYSASSNDYIQRFLFDTSDGDETLLSQSGGQRSSTNGLNNTNHNASREQEEPVRYFCCPYCDYTSNYGGDVRKHQARKHPNVESKVLKIIRQDSEPPIHPVISISHQSSHINEHPSANDDDHDDEHDSHSMTRSIPNSNEPSERKEKIKTVKKTDANLIQPCPSKLPHIPNFAPVRVFQCSSCRQQGTYKWVVERHIRAKHPDQPDAHVIELPAELAVRVQKITQPLQRFRCSLCPLQSKHTWVIIRHIKHFHTLQTASVLDIQPDGTPINDKSLSSQNGDFSGKSYNQDSDSSSPSSLYIETGADGQNEMYPSQEIEEDDDESEQINGTMIFTYKCSACDFTSNVQWDTQKHIQDQHGGQINVHILTQCRPVTNDNQLKKLTKQKTHLTMSKLPMSMPLSPTSAIAKAKFSPAVEEALLSLQGSKINAGIYAVQPKFGIKRLKCRHCFYRSNWKTDMIRHVRIRHNLTEPDHNKDMIMMTEQEARSTIETYENTFGKELRRRTFRTWNDWAKAEEEFTPKDGSLQYAEPKNGVSSNETSKSKKQSTDIVSLSANDEIKRLAKQKIKYENKKNTLNIDSILPIRNDEIKSLPNPSNIVSRLLLTASTSSNNHAINNNNINNNHNTISTNGSNGDEAPLDLSMKSSQDIQQIVPDENQIFDDDDDDDDDAEENEDEQFDESSTIHYLCSVCPYKHSNLSLVQRHISLHLTGQGVVCSLCSYTTSTNQSMINHMTIIHPTSQIQTTFPLTNRTSDVTIVEQHLCSQCSYQCDHAEGLELHRRLEHNDDEQYDIDSSSSTTAHEQDENDDEPLQLPVDTSQNLFHCPFCSSEADGNDHTNLEQFTIHVFTNHLNHITNNQYCPFCSFIAHTTSTYSLIEHIRLHFNGTLVQPDAIHGIENVKELFIEDN